MAILKMTTHAHTLIKLLYDFWGTSLFTKLLYVFLGQNNLDVGVERQAPLCVTRHVYRYFATRVTMHIQFAVAFVRLFSVALKKLGKQHTLCLAHRSTGVLPVAYYYNTVSAADVPVTAWMGAFVAQCLHEAHAS